MPKCNYYKVTMTTVNGELGGPATQTIPSEIYCDHPSWTTPRNTLGGEPKCGGDVNRCEIKGGFPG
jgi:hypothetical protein